MNGIPFLKPSFPSRDELSTSYQDLLECGIFSNDGPASTEFIEGICNFVQTTPEHVSLVASATSGIELALQALNISASGAHVLVASFTFPAGPLALRRQGLRPLFIDIDSETWQPDIHDARRVIESRKFEITAILLTNTFGTANDEIEEWEQLAGEYALKLVVDSAAGFGSQSPSGERIGNNGDCEIFSFHATKTLAVGEGGAVISKHAEVIKRINSLKNFGFDGHRMTTLMGTNAKLSELSCKIGVLQLEKLISQIEVRRLIFERYRNHLAPLGCKFQKNAGLSALPFVSAVLPKQQHRRHAVEALKVRGITSREYYNPPVHQHPFFASEVNSGLPVSKDVASRIISLPTYLDLQPQQIDFICGVLQQVVIT